jgi:toxin ParE1/3/4
MKKLPVVRSSAAEDDLIAIWQYIAKDNRAAASHMLRTLDRRIAELSRNPFAGECVEGRAPNMRRLVVKSYLIFYQVLDDSLRVVRVLHSSRQWEDLI